MPAFYQKDCLKCEVNVFRKNWAEKFKKTLKIDVLFEVYIAKGTKTYSMSNEPITVQLYFHWWKSIR